jgi:hypothetical protein
LGDPSRVVCGGGAYSILQSRLESGGDETKRCRKKKRRQRARLGSIGRKRDTARRCDDIGQSRDGTGEEKWMRRRQLG